MGIGATRTQKAKVAQLTIDGLADQRAGGPGWLHLVVVPGLTTIEAEPGSLINQHVMAKAVTGWMGQHRQSTGGMDGFDHRLSP